MSAVLSWPLGETFPICVCWTFLVKGMFTYHSGGRHTLQTGGNDYVIALHHHSLFTYSFCINEVVVVAFKWMFPNNPRLTHLYSIIWLFSLYEMTPIWALCITRVCYCGWHTLELYQYCDYIKLSLITYLVIVHQQRWYSCLQSDFLKWPSIYVFILIFYWVYRCKLILSLGNPAVMLTHIPCTKWPPFRRHFQVHFHE